MTSRLATDAEQRLVMKFFEGVEAGASQLLLGEVDLWIVEREGELAVTAASLDLIGLPDEVKAGADHVGMRIGTLENDGFHLDLQSAVMLPEVTRNQIVRVNEQGARMWIYGRDIIASSVLFYARGLRHGDACIVVNPRWEGIGIGEVVGAFKGKMSCIRPIQDLGAYLRDQG